MFHILALPRSRTYWLSKFLTSGNNLFLHESAWDNKEVEDFNGAPNIIGNASTSPVETLSMVDKDKCLIIERPLSEVLESLSVLYPGISFDLTGQQEALDSIDAYRVPFEEINNRLDDIWDFIHDDPMPEKKRGLVDKNLQNHKMIKDVEGHLAAYL